MFAEAVLKTKSGKQAFIIGAATLSLFAILIVLFFHLGNQTVYESKPFLAVINIVFLSVLPFAVAYISSISYLKSGLLQLLFLGGAMIAFGICNLIAAWGILSVNAPEWTNFLVTIHNVGVFSFAAITFAASIIASNRMLGLAPNTNRRRILNILAAYVSAVILSICLAVLTISNDIPPFVVSGSFTLLRQSVLVVTIMLLTFSSIIFGKKYLSSKSSIIYWYSLGLALIAIGILGILIEPHLGTALSWTGRATQYVGCVFFAIAALSKLPKSGTEENWVEAFGADRKQLTHLFSKMLNGFAYHRIVTNANGKPIDYIYLEVNDAFENATGLKKENIIGKKVTEVLPGIEQDPVGWIDIYGKVAQTGEPVRFKSQLQRLNKWFDISAYSPEKGYFITLFDDITARRKAEEDVREAEKRFRIVIENSRDGINLLDLKTGKYVFMSPAQVKLTGFTEEEINNISAEEAYERTHPDDREITIAQQKKVASGEDLIEPVEYRWKVKSGEYRWFSDSRKLVRDEHGQPIAMVGISRDITRRKKIEEALIKNEEEYRSLFSNMMDGFAYGKTIFDAQGKPVDFVYLKINDAFEKITGLRKDFVVGKKVTEVIPGIEKLNPELFEIYGRVAKTGRDEEFEIFFKPFDMWLSMSVYRPEEGFFATVFENITKRKESEATILALNERFKMAQHAAGVGVWDWDIKTGHIEWTTEMFELFGLDPKETVASFETWNSVLHPEDKEKAGAKINEALQTHSLLDNEYRIVKPDGQIIWINAKGIGIYDQRNEPIRMSGICMDISERRKSEEKLDEYRVNLEKLVEERTKQLQEKERLAAIGATAGMVGHDIRNPLQAITSDVFLAKTELASIPDSEEKKNALESIDEIEKNVDYINKIVQDLQDYARPLNPKIEESDLKSIVKALIAKNGLPKNIKVNVKIKDDARKIRVDSYYLNRILFNLVTNAVQAMPNGGKLTIDAHKEANDTVLSVKDTGVGIPQEIRDKMFTLMFTTKSKGQGFGLPVVKRMTESLGGTVTFESQEGKGTTFTVRLPPKKS